MRLNLRKSEAIYAISVSTIFAISIIINLRSQIIGPAYNPETASHYLEIVKLSSGKLLLEGPLTSHVWLRLSSFPYYVFYPLFLLTSFHPLTLGYLWAVTAGITLVLNYILTSKLFNKNTGLIAMILLFVSPNYNSLLNAGGFFPFVIPISLFLIYRIDRSLAKRSESDWQIYLAVSIMFCLHASAIILLPFVIALSIYMNKYSLKEMLKNFAAFVIPQLPLFINDMNNGFYMIRSFILWIPYKFFNFLSGKTFGVDKASVADNTFADIAKYYSLMVLPSSYPVYLGLGILLILVILGSVYIKFNNKNKIFKILALLLLYGIAALAIHKNPPAHYFMPVFIIPYILLAFILGKLYERGRPEKILLMILLFLIFAVNLNNRLMINRSEIPGRYEITKAVSTLIINDSEDKTFNIKRVGDFDFYPERFQQDYTYMFYWQGHAAEENSGITYYLIEDPKRYPEYRGTVIGNVYSVRVVRN